MVSSARRLLQYFHIYIHIHFHREGFLGIRTIVLGAPPWRNVREPLPFVQAKYVSHTKQQFVVTHSIRQTEILALLDICSTITLSVKIHAKKLLLLIFSYNHAILRCLSTKYLSSSLSPVKLCTGGLRQSALS